MTPLNISYKKRTIPVLNHTGNTKRIGLLNAKLQELEFDFEFRKKLKKIALIEMIGDVAIFKYHDGSKLYLEVS
jgi:hypothetical protein